MRALMTVTLCLATFATASADPFYLWLEAESLGGWTQVKSGEASGGTFAAGGTGSAFAGDYVPLPGKAKFRAWVRLAKEKRFPLRIVGTGVRLSDR